MAAKRRESGGRHGRRVEVRDVAREAGVTSATVSLALSNSPRISEATRARVRAAAEKLGYRRNPYISALNSVCRERRAGRASTARPLLVLCTAIEPSENASALFHSSLEGIQARASAKGFRMEVLNLRGEGMSGRHATRILMTRNAAGVLLLSSRELVPAEVPDLTRFASVSIGFSVSPPAINRVACDYFQAMLLAMEKCAENGSRRIGLVLSAEDNQRVNRHWLAAYLMGLERWSGPAKIPAWVAGKVFDADFPRWIKKYRPDVIVSAQGSCLRATLEEHGFSVPDRIGLVCLNKPAPDSEFSGIYQSPDLVAGRAVDMLIGTIERNERGLLVFPIALSVNGVWSPGETLQERPASSEMNRSGQQSAAAGPPPSMRDIAASLNVHVSTVSLSLRGSPRISPATRERVIAAARRLGYRQNPYVSELMRSRRFGSYPRARPRLAFVTAYPTPDGWRGQAPTIELCFQHARERAEERGFCLEEIWLPPGGRAHERITRQLHKRGIQGLMFAPLPGPDVWLPIEWEGFCHVAIGLGMSTPRVHCVSNDHYSSMRRTVRECYRLGYRRIGLAMKTHENANVQNRWLAAFLVQQRKIGDVTLRKPLIVDQDQLTERTMARWLRKERPDVVIAPHPYPWLDWLEGFGYSVPGDIGFANLSCPGRTSELSGIFQNIQLVGAQATDMLIGLIERNEYGVPEHPGSLLVDGLWVPGRTLKGV